MTIIVMIALFLNKGYILLEELLRTSSQDSSNKIKLTICRPPSTIRLIRQIRRQKIRLPSVVRAELERS